MGSKQRVLLWRQGQVLSEEAALALKPHLGQIPEEAMVIILSHDCDLAAGQDREPHVELAVAKRIEKLGNASFAKNARRLEIAVQRVGGGFVYVELEANGKILISKAELYDTTPSQDFLIDGKGLRILQSWLASRYRRAAFPEAFEAAFRPRGNPGAIDLQSEIATVLSKAGDHIRGLFFDLDKGLMVERGVGDEPYSLGIIILYTSEPDEPISHAAALKAQKSLEDLFDSAFPKKTDVHEGIVLEYIDVSSDSAMTIHQHEKLKQWRLDHLSLQSDLPTPMVEN